MKLIQPSPRVSLSRQSVTWSVAIDLTNQIHKLSDPKTHFEFD